MAARSPSDPVDPFPSCPAHKHVIGSAPRLISELLLHDRWVVPGSFKDTRNPFGPDDAIVRSAPIPGELQVTADAGSVFMQGAQFLLVESPRWLLSLSRPLTRENNTSRDLQDHLSPQTCKPVPRHCLLLAPTKHHARRHRRLAT